MADIDKEHRHGFNLGNSLNEDDDDDDMDASANSKK